MNGVYVNGSKLVSFKEQRLYEGDTISLGPQADSKLTWGVIRSERMTSSGAKVIRAMEQQETAAPDPEPKNSNLSEGLCCSICTYPFFQVCYLAATSFILFFAVWFEFFL